MREQTVTYKVYKFDELSDKAKEKVREWWRDAAQYDEWWDCIYMDAEEVGLKISGFDVGRGQSIDIAFTEDALYTAHQIKEEHGAACDSYDTADTFLSERDAIVDAAERNADGELVNEHHLDDALDGLEKDFLKAIGEDYWTMLRKEYECYFSDEAVDENIFCNDYEFTVDGSVFQA